MKEIKHNEQLLAIIDSVENFPKGLGFYGNKSDFIQVGHFRYDTNKIMRDHIHIKRERTTEKTQEILIVFKGKCAIRTYPPDHKEGEKPIATNMLSAGEFYILYEGGFGGAVMQDDTIMMEIKNGPYNVASDDEDRILL